MSEHDSSSSGGSGNSDPEIESLRPRIELLGPQAKRLMTQYDHTNFGPLKKNQLKGFDLLRRLPPTGIAALDSYRWPSGTEIGADADSFICSLVHSYSFVLAREAEVIAEEMFRIINGKIVHGNLVPEDVAMYRGRRDHIFVELLENFIEQFKDAYTIHTTEEPNWPLSNVTGPVNDEIQFT